jgi:hypothetical protein
MGTLLYPLLYQINTRVWLTELAEKLGRPALTSAKRTKQRDAMS